MAWGRHVLPAGRFSLSLQTRPPLSDPLQTVDFEEGKTQSPRRLSRLAGFVALLVFGVAAAAEPDTATLPAEPMPTKTDESTKDPSSLEPANQAAAVQVTGQPVLRLPEIVITGQSSKGQAFETGVTRKVFEERPGNFTLTDVLNRLPSVTTSGPDGEKKRYRLRGLTEDFARFEFDGVQLPGVGNDRAFQLNRLSPLYVENVRIIRNPTAEIESDGIGGRVVADSRPIPKELLVDLNGGFGGINSLDARLIQNGIFAGTMLNDNFGFNSAFNYLREPVRKDKTKKVFENGTLTATESENERKTKDNFNFFADLLWHYGAGEFHLKPMSFYLEERKSKKKIKRQDGKDPEKEIEDNNLLEQQTWGFLGTHTHEFSSGWRLESDANFFLTGENKDEEEKQVSKDKGSGFEPDKRTVRTLEIIDRSWQFGSKAIIPHEFVLPSELRTGFSFRFQDRDESQTDLEIKASDGSVTEKPAPQNNFKLDEILIMPFIQNDFLVTDRLSVLAGLRVEQTILNTTSGDGASASRSFTDVNPSFHVTYRAADTVTFTGAVSRTLNRPRFNELSPFIEEKGDRLVEGNPNLNPARSWNFDLGAEYATPNVLLGINLFRKEITDVIEEVDTGKERDGKEVFRFENVGSGFLQGIEFVQQADLGRLVSPVLRGLSIWANETILDSKLEDQTGQKRRFNEQPSVIANLGFDYHLTPTDTTLTFAAKYVDDLFKFTTKDEREVVDERWTIDLGLRQRITESTTLKFDALNLTNSGTDKTKVSGDKVEQEKERAGRVFFVGFETRF